MWHVIFFNSLGKENWNAPGRRQLAYWALDDYNSIWIDPVITGAGKILISELFVYANTSQAFNHVPTVSRSTEVNICTKR
jgi:hypothetical protein